MHGDERRDHDLREDPAVVVRRLSLVVPAVVGQQMMVGDVADVPAFEYLPPRGNRMNGQVRGFFRKHLHILDLHDFKSARAHLHAVGLIWTHIALFVEGKRDVRRIERDGGRLALFIADIEVLIDDLSLIHLVDPDERIAQGICLIGDRYFDLKITGSDGLTSCLML